MNSGKFRDERQRPSQGKSRKDALWSLPPLKLQQNLHCLSLSCHCQFVCYCPNACEHLFAKACEPSQTHDHPDKRCGVLVSMILAKCDELQNTNQSFWYFSCIRKSNHNLGKHHHSVTFGLERKLACGQLMNQDTYESWEHNSLCYTRHMRKRIASLQNETYPETTNPPQYHVLLAQVSLVPCTQGCLESSGAVEWKTWRSQQTTHQQLMHLKQ